MFCKMNIRLLSVIFVCLAASFLLDVITTYIALNNNSAYEINPFLAKNEFVSISIFNVIAILIISAYFLTILYIKKCISFIYIEYTIIDVFKKFFSTQSEKPFLKYLQLLFFMELIIIKLFLSLSNLSVIYGFPGFLVIGSQWVGRSAFGDLAVLFLNITVYSIFLMPVAHVLFRRIMLSCVLRAGSGQPPQCPQHGLTAPPKRTEGGRASKIRTALKIMGGSLLFLFFGS